MLGSAGLMIKPDYLRGLFQPQQLYDYSPSYNPLETSQLNSVLAFSSNITQLCPKETLGLLRPHNSHLLEILFGELLIRILFQVSHVLCIVASKSWAFAFLTSKLFSKWMM